MAGAASANGISGSGLFAQPQADYRQIVGAVPLSPPGTHIIRTGITPRSLSLAPSTLARLCLATPRHPLDSIVADYGIRPTVTKDI